MTAPVQIRWLIRSDWNDVLDIERTCFEQPWTEEDFLVCLRQKNCIGMVAERDLRIVGFMVYELHKTYLVLLNFAVSPELHRQDIGTAMFNRLVDKLSQQNRSCIELLVRETNLDAQLFFRKQGFRAVSVLRGHYDDTGEDAYLMRYSVASVEDLDAAFVPVNRCFSQPRKETPDGSL